MRPNAAFSLLNLTAYLTVFGAAVSGVLQLDRILLRWQVALLLAVFILLHSRLPQDIQSLPARRRANLIIALQAAIIIYLLVATGLGFSFLILFFILSASAALYNPLRLTLVWIALFTLCTAWQQYQASGWSGLYSDMVIFAGGYLFFSFITNALSTTRQAQAQNERLLAELQAKNAQLEEYARQVETLAAVEERNRLAREVHDTLGHRLTSSAVQLEAAQRLIPSNDQKAAELIGVVRTQVREALSELRQTVGRLRDPLELELSLPQALRRLVESFQTTPGLKVHLETPAHPCEINRAQRLALYRTAQEGLTNIQRHAQATQAWLSLECTPNELRLDVRDNGIGMPTTGMVNGGFGLRGLQERASALGGNIRLAPHPSGGTVLSMILPVVRIIEDADQHVPGE